MQKKIAALAVIFTLVLSMVGAIAGVCGEPSVGVKKGDWMDYNVVIGGHPPPIHNVNWLRIEVLQVQSDAFKANFTVRYPNGTLYTTTWQFNFTEGNTEGWIIIPSNLSPGDMFLDLHKSETANVTIQRQEQKTVAGATRTIIFANDSLRTKEWDKATGVFTNSSETFKNWSAYVYLTSTNIWSPKIEGLNPKTFYVLVAASIVVAVSVSALEIIFFRRKRRQVNSA